MWKGVYLELDELGNLNYSLSMNDLNLASSEVSPLSMHHVSNHPPGFCSIHGPRPLK